MRTCKKCKARVRKKRPSHKCTGHSWDDGRRARTLEDLGRLREAVRLYRTASRRCFRSADLYYDLGIALHRIGRDKSAIRAVSRAQRLNRYDPVTAYEYAFWLWHVDEEALAERYYRRAVQLRPRYASAWNNLGLIQFEDRRYLEAEIAFRRAIRVERRRIGTSINLALSLLGQGRILEGRSEASAGLRVFHGMRPRSVSRNSRFLHAYLLAVVGKEGEARSVFEGLGELTEDDLWGVTSAADALVSSGHYAESAELWEFALSFRDDMPDAWFELSRCYRALDEIDKAERACLRAIEEGGDKARGLYVLGGILRARDRMDEAVEKYREVLSLEPTNVDAMNNMGLSQIEAGYPHEGEETIRTALLFNSSDAVHIRNLGFALEEQERTDEAATEYLKAARIGPTSADQWLYTAELLEEVGRMGDAMEARIEAEKSLEIPEEDVPRSWWEI